MKFRENQWLDDQIKSWAKDGLISVSQADKILAKRQADSKSNILNATNLLAALGGLCVVLGVVLIISYNWESIPHLLKIAVYLLLLAGLGEASLHIPEKYKLGRTAIQVGWLLMPLAGIGLWAQIYQLSGDPLKPILIWLALGLPLVWKGQDDKVAFLHAAGIGWAAYTGAFSQGTWFTMTTGYYSERWNGTLGSFFSNYIGQIICLGLIWSLGFYQSRTFLKDKGRWIFALVFLAFLLDLSCMATPFYYGDGADVFLHFSALVVLYFGFTNILCIEEGFWLTSGWIGLASILYAMTFLWHATGNSDRFSLSLISLAVVEMVAGSVLMVIKKNELRFEKQWGSFFYILLVIPVVLSFGLIFDVPTKIIAFIANLAFLGLAVWLVREGMASNRPKRINGGVALVGLLVFTRFIDYFGTLLQSGFAFIVIGLVFVALAFGLNRGRRELLARVQGGKP